MTSNIDTAVILAAGLGTRLRPLTQAIPKAMIEVNGIALIERSITMLVECDICRIVIVIGYEGEQLKRFVTNLQLNVELIFVYNHDYQTTGSMASLAVAAEQVHGGCLLLESDLIYEAKLLTSIINTAYANAIATTKPSSSGDEVYLLAGADDSIQAISKQLSRVEYPNLTEFVGVCKLSKDFVSELACIVKSQQYKAWTCWHYEEAMIAFANMTDHWLYQLYLPSLLWLEIDKPADLQRAIDDIFPRIHKKEVSFSS